MKDGRTISLFADDVRGSPANPMSKQEVVDKAMGLIKPRLGETKTRKLVDTIWRLGDDCTAKDLVKLAS